MDTKVTELKLLLDQSQPAGSLGGEQRLRQAWKRSDEYFTSHPPPADARPLDRDEIYADRLLTPRRNIQGRRLDRVFFDTNILFYAHDPVSSAKRARGHE
jgi:hypothetical protein